MYNYREAMYNDITEYINNHLDSVKHYGDKEAAFLQLRFLLLLTDEVTGNASGSYTFSTYEAEENLIGNKDLLIEALDEFGGNYKEALLSAEYADVTIRCYLLSDVLASVLSEMEADGFWDESEDEDSE